MESPWPDPWASEPREDLARRYGITRMAFRLGALAVGLQSANILILIGAFFELWEFKLDHRWGLIIGTPLSWSAVIAAYLLVGRWRDGGWNRRAVLLAMMNTFDVYLWAAQNSKLLGLGVPAIENSWVAYSVGVLQWFELMLFGSLAADVAVHLGRDAAAAKEQKSRSFAMVGLSLWSLVLLIGTRLRPGGLPRFHLPLVREAYLLWSMSELTLALTAFQVMVLCMLASRECGQVLRELRKGDHEYALLKPQADHRDSEP